MTAGIDKADERGRTIDVHALRHSFGTLLSKGGVAPRTAQAAMRHSSIDLTMNTYTDPKLLDVYGALDSLPSLHLNASPSTERQMMRATGTDNQDATANPRHATSAGANVVSQFAPEFAPDVGERGQSVSFAVISSTESDELTEGQVSDENSVKPMKKPSFAGIANKGQSIGATGFEPATSTSRTCRPTVPSDNQSGLTLTDNSACTTTCTNLPENAHSDGSEPGTGSPGSDRFAAALMMIAGLPLSDTDKAEAVKRLLREARR